MENTAPLGPLDPLRAISPSQIETFRDCPRKWGLRYLDLLEAPPHPSALLGTASHSVGERYFKSGVLPDYDTEEGAIFGATIPHWPDPRKVTVESELYVQATWREVAFHGYQDAGWWQPGEKAYVVGDLKTTSDFRYAKTGEVLATDPQGLVYSLAALQRHPQLAEVTLHWVYTRTRGARKALPMGVTLTLEQVQEGMDQHVLPVAQEILLARTLTSSSELPQNPATCPKYGGCWYGKEGHCKVDPIKALGGLIMSDALKKRLEASKKAQASTASIAKEVPLLEEPKTEAPEVNPPTGQPRSAILDRIAGLAKGTPPAAPVAVVQAPLRLSQAVAPPAAPKAPPAAPVAVAPKAPPAALNLNQLGACRFCGEEEEPLSPEGLCADCAPLPEVRETPVQKVVSDTPSKAPSPEARNVPVLCIGCIPDGPFQDVREYVQRAHQIVCQTHKVPDYRLVEYGKGVGHLVVALQGVFQENPQYLTGYLYADPRDPMVAVCIGLLSSLVDTTIRSTS